MAYRTEIISDSNHAKVSRSGELVVAPLHYDEAVYQYMDVINIAYNFAVPLPQKQMVITGFVASGNKNITGSSESIVEIYEADNIDEITVSKALVTIAVAKNQVVAPTPLRILVNEGKWVNAKMDDDDVHLTMFGYYIAV